MKLNLGISSRKMISIGFLLVTIVIALALSGFPFLVSNHPANLPVHTENFDTQGTKTEPQHVPPVAKVVTDVVKPIHITKQINTVNGSTKVFEQIFSSEHSGEKFQVQSKF